MKIKHLLIIPSVIYLIYLNIYTITHFDLFDRTPSGFEGFAGTVFVLTCFMSVIGIIIIFCYYSEEISKFLNKKI
jgi:hypothetical protein